jgi:ACT domain-containing protein
MKKLLKSTLDADGRFLTRKTLDQLQIGDELEGSIAVKSIDISKNNRYQTERSVFSFYDSGRTTPIEAVLFNTTEDIREGIEESKEALAKSQVEVDDTLIIIGNLVVKKAQSQRGTVSYDVTHYSLVGVMRESDVLDVVSTPAGRILTIEDL